MSTLTWCHVCGCNADNLCACARGCPHHPTTVTVPDRVRRLVVECIVDNPNHGRGAVGESLAAKLAATTNRQRVDLTAAERVMLIDEAETLFEVSADDASWEPDAKADRQAARTCLRKLGVQLSADELVEREWTFKHRVIVKAGQLGGEWIDHNGNDRVFRDVPRGAVAGTVWTISANDDGTRAAPKAATYTGRRHPNEDEREAWAVLDRVTKIEKDREAQLRKLAAAEGETIDNMTIAEVAKIIRGAPWTRRAAIVAVVLDRLGPP